MKVQPPALLRRSGAVAALAAGAGLRTLDVVPAEATVAYRSLRRTLVFGVAATAALLLGGGALLTQTVIAGAIITQGTLVVESGSKKVQHQTGGVVAQLLVREDDAVVAGQTLVVLDQTVDQARLSAIATSLVQQRIRLARLAAERDDLTVPAFPAYDASVAIEQRDFDAMVSSEKRQFSLRREDRDGQRAQLRERVAQAEEQVTSTEAQLASTTSQYDVVSRETADLRDLYAKQLVPYQRLSEMERTLSQLNGSQGSLRSDLASGKGKIAELNQMVLQVDQSLRAELTDQIAAAQAQVADLTQQKVIAKDQLDRAVITAPLDGVVHELAVHTVGGVVQPAETLMTIVPEHDRLVGEVRLSPNDIDQLYPGQAVTIHFSAFDRGTTPALTGRLASISPDLVEDPHRGIMYYTGRIETEDSELAKLPRDLKLVPGMPVEAFVRTADRTILSYLLKPLMDQIDRALRG